MDVPTQNLRSTPAMLRFVLATGLGLTLDLVSKRLAFAKLSDLPGGYAFIPGWLHFQVMENHGAVFGIAQGQRWALVAVSIGAIGFILYLFLMSGRQWATQIVLGMLLAGVLGNMWDRLEYGYVRDMIYALPGRTVAGHEVFPWIFNIADSLLCTGIAILVTRSVILSMQEPVAKGRGFPLADRSGDAGAGESVRP